jgi:hypothetical protein
MIWLNKPKYVRSIYHMSQNQHQNHPNKGLQAKHVTIATTLFCTIICGAIFVSPNKGANERKGGVIIKRIERKDYWEPTCSNCLVVSKGRRRAWARPQWQIQVFQQVQLRGLRPVSVGVSLEFHLHLIACHICIFDDMSTF